jgi:hypothetical protein
VRGSDFVARWQRRAMGTVRVMAYGFCASLLIAGLAAHRAVADFKEGTLDAGREMAQLGDVLGDTKTLFVNGTVMNVSTAFTDQSIKDVLDRFQTVCEAHPDALARALADIPSTLQAAVDKAVPNKALQMGVVRSEVRDDGALTCLTNDRPFALKDLPARLKSFEKSHDFSELGQFRYVYANKTKTGATHVMTVWTQGSFKVGEMFPAKGDAAGFDSTLVPRPPDSRRVFTATSAQVPYGLHIYDVAHGHDDVFRFYDGEMKSRGWTRTDEKANTVVYVKDTGRMLYVTAHAKGEHTFVTAIETARRDQTTEADVHVEN